MRSAVGSSAAASETGSGVLAPRARPRILPYRLLLVLVSVLLAVWLWPIGQMLQHIEALFPVALHTVTEFAAIVEAGPELARDGVVRWRRVDLQRVIKERFGVDYHERYVGVLLHEMGFSHMSARPRHPAQNPEIIAAFKKTSRTRSARI